MCSNVVYEFTNKYDLINVDDQMVFLPIETESIMEHSLFSVEGIGQDIIMCINNDFTLEKMVEFISTNYSADRDTIYEDISSFLEDLLNNKIIQIKETNY